VRWCKKWQEATSSAISAAIGVCNANVKSRNIELTMTNIPDDSLIEEVLISRPDSPPEFPPSPLDSRDGLSRSIVTRLVVKALYVSGATEASTGGILNCRTRS
jgi:hypothetical protein